MRSSSEFTPCCAFWLIYEQLTTTHWPFHILFDGWSHQKHPPSTSSSRVTNPAIPPLRLCPKTSHRMENGAQGQIGCHGDDKVDVKRRKTAGQVPTVGKRAGLQNTLQQVMYGAFRDGSCTAKSNMLILRMDPEARCNDEVTEEHHQNKFFSVFYTSQFWFNWSFWVKSSTISDLRDIVPGNSY